MAEFMKQRYENKLKEAVERLASLPALLVHHGEYCNLLVEARDLYVHEYYYSCIAMCGIVAERIAKDLFTRNILIIKENKAVFPPENAKRDLESFGAREICTFLINAGILNDTLKTSFKELGELRNKYAHAGGKEPQKDAVKAIKYLHAIVEGTVSIFKDFEIHEGKLVRKREKRNANVQE